MTRSRRVGSRHDAILIGLGLAVVGLTASPLLGQSSDPTKGLTTAELEARATRDSLDADAHYQLGERYAESKHWEEAVTQFKTAAAIEPHYARAYLALAYLTFARNSDLLEHSKKGRLKQEERDTIIASSRLERKAFLIDPLVDVVGVRAEALLGSQVRITRDGYILHLQYVPLESLPSRQVWFHGLAAAHAHDYREAVRAFQILLNRETSREDSDSLIRIPLRTNDMRYVLAVTYQGWGKPADAMEQYQAAVTGDLGLYMAHSRLAQVYAEHQMWDKAIEEMEAAIQANPDDSELLVDLGKIQQEAGQLLAAEQTLRQAVDRNPRDPRIPYALAVVEMLNGHTADARREYAHFAAIAPSRMSTEIEDAKQRLATLPP